MAFGVQTLTFNVDFTNTSGVTDYFIFTKKDVDFVGTGVPSGYQAVIVPLNSTDPATYTATGTGTYFYRIYSYNREASKFSYGYSSGSVVVENLYSVKDIIVSNLTLNTNTGNLYFSGDKSFSTSELNPSFGWSLSNQEGSIGSTDYSSRITIRAPSETYNPTLPIYAEYIMPISGSATGTSFQFDFDLNKSITGGPYRNYDFVVEMVDSQGVTSAGNTTTPQSLMENGWVSNPDGFDIIRVNNPIISGFLLSSGIDNLTFNNSTYTTNQHFDLNGNILINFSGLIMPIDVQGGRVFTSRSFFTQSDAITGNINVNSAEFRIDNNASTILAQTRLNTANLQSGYCALMLYDSFDLEYKKSNLTGFWQNLYLSNVVGAGISGNLSELSIKNFIEFQNISGNNGQAVKLSLISTGGNSWSLVNLVSGRTIIFSSYKP